MKFKSFHLLRESFADFMKYLKDLPHMSRQDVQHLLNSSLGFVDGFPSMGGGDYDYLTARRAFVKKYAWSLPCKEAMDAFKEYARPPIYDVFAGTGYWAKILTENGVPVIASDLNISSKHNEYRHSSSHFPVKRRNVLRRIQDFKRYSTKEPEKPLDVMMCWIPYGCSLGINVAESLPSGSRIFLIGEDWGGCTGTETTHSYLHEHYFSLKRVGLPRFWGLNDFMEIFEKK